MHGVTQRGQSLFGLPAPEWSDVATLSPTDTSRRYVIASVTLMVIIAVLDSFLRGILAILFVLPLILLAHGGTQRQLRWVAGIMFVLTFVAYFIKIQFIPQPPNTQFFDFRIINRGFTALMILALGRMLQLWIGWREDQDDPELSEPFRSQDLFHLL